MLSLAVRCQDGVVTLLDRVSEKEALDGLLAAVCDGLSSVIVVRGEAGVVAQADDGLPGGAEDVSAELMVIAKVRLYADQAG
jgi:hypothetical protein